MFPSCSKLTNALIWATFMACFDMVWDVVIAQEGISAATAGRNFIITGVVYYVWAHGYLLRKLAKRRT